MTGQHGKCPYCKGTRLAKAKDVQATFYTERARLSPEEFEKLLYCFDCSRTFLPKELEGRAQLEGKQK